MNKKTTIIYHIPPPPSSAPLPVFFRPLSRIFAAKMQGARKVLLAYFTLLC